jgi:miniconductance mechanosensitive channel
MICQIAIVSLVMRAIILAIKAMYAMLDNHEEASQTARSLKGVVQLCQTIVICIGAIIIISIIIGRSPLFILSGLGASAAILLLVFKETILGFMASIRLNSNNMLQVGDWITMSSRNINGIVKEICLTTVKIENYDMTIVTVPPYALVSESFQNWRGMQDKGARRIMRSLNIDISSVRHCTSEEIIRFAKEPWGKNLKPDGKYVNLSLYRQALKYRVEHEPTFRENADEKMYCMVRELQPTPYGIPVQIYLFTSETAWPDYEEVQASLMDNIIVLTSDFGLKVFQVERL